MTVHSRVDVLPVREVWVGDGFLGVLSGRKWLRVFLKL